MSTYRELLRKAGEVLKQHGIADAELDAWYLLAHVFGINRVDYLLNADNTVLESGINQYNQLVERRASHIPLQHLTGTQEFMGLEFEVNEDVLIPRQDTEILVEEVLKVCEGRRVLDMCTGSGCIIVSLAKFGKISNAVGVDVSTKALKVASKNSRKHKVNIEFIHSDLFGKVEGVYDIIVSNPPYIPTEEIERLMPEVKIHEPLTALDGSKDGLVFYKRITASLDRYLIKGGFIFYEIGYNQGEEVKNILQEAGYVDVTIKKDLSGLDRVVFGKRP